MLDLFFISTPSFYANFIIVVHSCVILLVLDYGLYIGGLFVNTDVHA